jgi:hypothetical protein
MEKWKTAVQPRTHNTKVKQIHDGTSSMLVAVRIHIFYSTDLWQKRKTMGKKNNREILLLQFLALIGITFIGEVHA